MSSKNTAEVILGGKVIKLVDMKARVIFESCIIH